MPSRLDYRGQGKAYPFKEYELANIQKLLSACKNGHQLDLLYKRIAVRSTEDGLEVDAPNLAYYHDLGADIEYLILFEELAHVKLSDNKHANGEIVHQTAARLSLHLVSSLELGRCLWDVLYMNRFKARCDLRKRIWFYVYDHDAMEQYLEDRGKVIANMKSEFKLLRDSKDIEIAIKFILSWWDSRNKEDKTRLHAFLNGLAEHDLKMFKWARELMIRRSEYIKLKIKKVKELGLLRKAKELDMIHSNLDFDKYLDIWRPKSKELCIPPDQGALRCTGVMKENKPTSNIQGALRCAEVTKNAMSSLSVEASQGLLQKSQGKRNIKQNTSSCQSRGPRNMNKLGGFTNRFAGLEVQD